jgi:hypothetical protein
MNKMVNLNEVESSLSTVLNDFREIKNSDTAKKIYEEIDLGVKNALADPKEYKKLLLYSSKLSDYSFRNQMLLYLQMTPEQKSLPLVNSFSEWKKQNVSINKGSRAMAIVAPRTFKAFERAGRIISVLKATNDEKTLIANGTIPTIVKKGFSYSFSVFHVQNTNANIDDMIKREDIKSTLTDEQKEKIFNHLKNIIEAKGTPIVEKDLLLLASGTAQIKAEHKITLNTRNTLEENITTLLHEFVHDALHFDKKITSIEDVEIQAESISYMISRNLGLKNESSFEYLANWSSEKSTQQLGENMQTILEGYRNVKDTLAYDELLLKNDTYENEEYEME